MMLVRSKRPLAGGVVFASSLADSELCVMSICSKYWLAHKSIHCVDDPRDLDFSLLRSFWASGPFRSGRTEKERAQDIGSALSKVRIAALSLPFVRTVPQTIFVKSSTEATYGLNFYQKI